MHPHSKLFRCTILRLLDNPLSCPFLSACLSAWDGKSLPCCRLYSFCFSETCVDLNSPRWTRSNDPSRLHLRSPTDQRPTLPEQANASAQRVSSAELPAHCLPTACFPLLTVGWRMTRLSLFSRWKECPNQGRKVVLTRRGSLSLPVYHDEYDQSYRSTSLLYCDG